MSDDKDFEQCAALIRSSFKRLFETLLEQTADRVYIKDTKGRFVFASNALAHAHGLKDRSELDGLTDFDFFTHENAESFYAEEQEILRSNQPVINRISKEKWKGGSATWSSTSKVPLRTESGTPIGILGITRDVTEQHISKEKLRKANDTMRADYESAEKVQRVMIPGHIPKIKGIEIAHIWQPMSAVGGDIISFPQTPTGELLFFLADVCGHGVQAAFYTVLLKYITGKSADAYSGSPDAFLDHVNAQITEQMSQGFVTAMAGHFDPKRPDGSRNLYLSNAGHPLLILLRAATGKAETLKLPGSMVMGLPSGKASKTVVIPMQKNDRVYMFTDGITEASDSDENEFGIVPLRKSIEALQTKTLQEGLTSIYKQAIAHTMNSEQQDDISILAFELTK